MTATSPSPANAQVSRARCIGLQRTRANVSLASTARIRSASRRPLPVNGMSVVPVCWPVRLHAVSPCLIANTFTFASVSSDIVGLGRADPCRRRFLPPSPTGDLRHVVAVAGNKFLVVDQLVADRLLGVSGPCAELGHAVDHIAHQVEAIEVVQYAHVERRGSGALFLVAAHVDVVMAASPISQPVNERWVTVKGKNDRLVRRE